MSKFNLFSAARIAMEEEVPASSSKDIDVAQNDVDNIESEQLTEEVAKLSSEIEQVSNHIEEGIDEAEALDEAIEQGEEVLENNEGGDVPDEAVEVAQEALNDAILILAGREAKNQFKPSLESCETNFQKLRISLEGAKDFASNVWEKIKELFAKFATMMKKLIVKFGALFDKGAKKADSLGKVLNKKTQLDNDKIDDDFLEKIGQIAPTFTNNGLQKGLDLMVSYNKDASAHINDIKSALTALVDQGTLTSNKRGDDIIKKLSISEAKDFEQGQIYAVLFKNYIWAIDAEGKTNTVKVEGQKISSIDIEFSKMAGIVSNVKDQAKKYGSFSKSILDIISKASKDIDKLKANELKNSGNYEDKATSRKKANLAYKIVTASCFKTLKSYQECIYGALNIIAAISRIAK